MKQRLTPARDIGRYKGYGDEAWNDEVLMGAKESEFEWQVERLLEDAEQDGKEAGEVEQRGMKKVEREAVDRPMPRRTEADEKNDRKSLNRALQRTLYLLVKNKDGKWQFPQDRLQDEHLHGAVSRIITQSGGVNMNTWVVGHNPIGHYQVDYAKPIKQATGLLDRGTKTFFLKARVMAGQLNLKENKLGSTDFEWLAKDELQEKVEESYWRGVKNMLAER
ncbi:hypothetical protein GQ44DRAFT_708859 [Phaeosphaeriaceae sp. PMI808]|nr:hypothetical protein GQ44DRAFT_708859 [Phaeosphaeriaceae sp. PMI808]